MTTRSGDPLPPLSERIEVVPATEADAVGARLVLRAAMKRYMEESAIPSPPDALRETVADLSRYIRQDHVFVARLEENVLGIIRLSVDTDNTVYISRFAVLPGHRSLGLGRRLFAAAEARALELGASEIRLHTAMTNGPLVRFYQSRGYRVTHTSVKRGYPRALMIKPLTADAPDT